MLFSCSRNFGPLNIARDALLHVRDSDNGLEDRTASGPADLPDNGLNRDVPTCHVSQQGRRKGIPA